MLPEQIWDAHDIPERRAFTSAIRPARRCRWSGLIPSISSCDARSTTAGSSTCPAETSNAICRSVGSPFAVWRPRPRRRDDAGRQDVAAGGTGGRAGLPLDHRRLAVQPDDRHARHLGLGMLVADVPSEKLNGGAKIIFTFESNEAGHWEGRDFTVTVG